MMVGSFLACAIEDDKLAAQAYDMWASMNSSQALYIVREGAQSDFPSLTCFVQADDWDWRSGTSGSAHSVARVSRFEAAWLMINGRTL